MLQVTGTPIPMMQSLTPRTRGALCGLAAAALFGVSAPIAKLLLADSGPYVLAGLLYLGAGLGLVLFTMTGRADVGAATPREAQLRATDIPALLGVIVAGGVLGPVLMLIGLRRVSGVVGALLLNLEAPLTVLVAVAFFREHLGRRETAAVAMVLVGVMGLAWSPTAIHLDVLGVLALTGACASWAIDNNLTQRLTVRDPVALVRVKALSAGALSLLAGAALGEAWPPAQTVGAALLVGSVSYGVSVVLDAYALRLLGAAREAAFFATAPFMGAVAAIPLLGETWSVSQVAAAAVMAGGVAVLLRARHGHLHDHPVLDHDHAHVHDAHHQHIHVPLVPDGATHSHPHRHDALAHDHPHVSDLHHRHRH